MKLNLTEYSPAKLYCNYFTDNIEYDEKIILFGDNIFRYLCDKMSGKDSSMIAYRYLKDCITFDVTKIKYFDYLCNLLKNENLILVEQPIFKYKDNSKANTLIFNKMYDKEGYIYKELNVFEIENELKNNIVFLYTPTSLIFYDSEKLRYKCIVKKKI